MDSTPIPPAPRTETLLQRLQRSPRLQGYAAALFGAAMVALALPLPELGLPIVVALVPVLVLARSRPWRSRFRMGWLMGFLYHLVLFRWIPFTVTEMTPIPLPVAWIMWWLYAAWHGMQVGVFLALVEPARRWAMARIPAGGAVVVALVWVAVEWVWPVIFPWSLGHAFWRVGPVAAIQAFVGVSGLAFFVALVNAALAELWCRGARRAVQVAAAVLAVFLAAGFAWYLHAEAALAAPRRTLRTAVVQPNYALEEKKHANLAQRRKFLARLEGQLRALPRDRYDLIVASEGAFPMTWRLDAETYTGHTDPYVAATRQILATLAAGPHTDAILGGLRAEGKETRNAAVHVGPEGHIVGHYDKRVLVPFSEYVPLSGVFPALKNAIPGIGNFEPGTDVCRFQVQDVKVACGICYETMFAGEARESAGDDAALYVNLTIDTWFGNDIAPVMHLMAHASRAVELGVPVVRAALTGISAVILPTGEVVASLGSDLEGVLPVDVPIVDLAPPYRATGPVFAWLALAAAAIALGLAFRARRELFPGAHVDPVQDV